MERQLLPRFTSALAVLALSAALLSACGDGADPDPSPSTATESTTTVEPSTDYTIPPRPEDVRKPDEPDLSTVDINSAYELARYYLDLYPYVKATGDTIEWEKYAHPECEYCATVLDEAEIDIESGSWSEVSLGVEDTAWFSVDGNVDYRIDFLVSRSEYKTYHSETADSIAPAEHAVIIGVSVDNDALLVKTFDVLDESYFGSVELP